jgi:hypothetical protein
MERVTWPNADWWDASPGGPGESETIFFLSAVHFERASESCQAFASGEVICHRAEIFFVLGPGL